jgi:phosphatidate phosphatase PAH1
MPEGPLFMNKESISQALYREVVSKQSVEYKSGVLAAVAEAFRLAGSGWRTPFTVGIGESGYNVQYRLNCEIEVTPPL